MSRSGQYGTGASTFLYGVYSFPYEREGLTISSVSPNGIANIEFRNSTIVLGSGERWEDRRQWIEADEGGYTYTIQLTRTDVIFNHGFLKKTDIIPT
jgi:hypothetical protein